MLTRALRHGLTGGASEVVDFEAAVRLNESGSVNLSPLMMNDGTGPATAFDRQAEPRGARVAGRADGTQGGNLTCAFS